MKPMHKLLLAAVAVAMLMLCSAHFKLDTGSASIAIKVAPLSGLSLAITPVARSGRT